MAQIETVYRTEAPTSGYWLAGSRAINSDWSDGEPIQWVCTASGEPGTWQPQYLTAPATAGTSPIATAVVTHPTNSPVMQSLITLSAAPVSVTDANAYGGTKILDFPEGRILILGVTASVQWAVTTDRTTTINDNASLTWGLGTATASNATLTGTMVDLLPKTTKVLSVATTGLNTASTAALAASAHFDGTSTAKDAYLNAAFETDTDIDGDGTLTATGTILVTWINLGDY